MATARGDGRVLLGDRHSQRASARSTWTRVHGDLANDRRHFAAIVDLLATGTTSELPTSPPQRRAAAEQFEMREPTAGDGAGRGRARRRRARRPAAEGQWQRSRRPGSPCAIVHDNLTNARSPVLVSHYKDDVIVAAEAYLDRWLDGRLSELLRMELYPGPINTGVVVLNEASPGDLAVHPGAIVAGLGGGRRARPRVADVDAGPRADPVRRRLRRTDAAPAAARGSCPAGIVSAPVTAILVGSGEGGVSLSDSVRALLRAVLQANQRLRGGAAGRGRRGEHRWSPRSIASTSSSCTRIAPSKGCTRCAR